MKNVFLLKYLLIYSTLAYKHQIPQISPARPPPDPSNPPIFTWTSPTSLHVIYPDLEEDFIKLLPSYTGEVKVKCLYEGRFSKEKSASTVVSGCIDSPSVYITVYSSHLRGTVFTVKGNVTTEETNPYPNGGIEYFEDNSLEDKPPIRVKRSDFYYYSGEDQDDYVDLDFDGPLAPTPPNLLLKYKLAFDETLKAHFGGDEDAARAYTIEVCTHASLHMKHSSLGVKIHMLRVGTPTFAQGKSLKFSSRLEARKSLTEVQNMKEVEPIPLIMFCKSDDLSTTVMGVSWPGRKGGACNDDMGAAALKWRSNIALAAVTLAHESGHLTGQLHDSSEDRRNKIKELFDPQNPCEGDGIMSDGSRSDRPGKWSSCSQDRLLRWFPKHGKCLEAPDCSDGSDWSAPCVCGSTMCQPEHTYCMRTSSNEALHQCLTRRDLGLQLQSCGLYNEEWTTAVWLNDDSTQIIKNVKEKAFNALFFTCPVVQYTRNGAVHSVYVRTSPIPANFNAFSVFTNIWTSTNNMLNTDFRIYDDLEDAKNDKGAWNFCNYDDGSGYPRDCGKSGRVNNQWFKMPKRGKSLGITSGIGFQIYTGSECPSPLNTVFYRVSSSGEAAEEHPYLMTDYYLTGEIVNGFPVYKGKYYMYVDTGGRWFVGPTAGATGGYLYHPTTPAASHPPVSGWKYGKDGTFRTDSTLKVVAISL